MAGAPPPPPRESPRKSSLPEYCETTETELLVSKPLTLCRVLSEAPPERTVQAPRSPDTALYADACRRARHRMLDGDTGWADVLSATLPRLVDNDCIRLVFMDGVGARALERQGVIQSDPAWIAHTVLLFGDSRPVDLVRKQMPFLSWILRSDFLFVRGTYLEKDVAGDTDEDTRDLALFQSLARGLPWGQSSLVLPTAAERRAHLRPQHVSHDTFLDFLSYALDQAPDLAARLEDVRLFSTVPLCGGAYEGGLREEQRAQSTVFEF